MPFPFFKQPPTLDPLTPAMARQAATPTALAASRPSQSWSLWFSRIAFLLNTLAGYVGETPIVFQLPGVRADGTDTLTIRPRLYLKQNAQSIVVGQPLAVHYIGIAAKVAPALTDYYPDVLISRDGGTNWTTIFINPNIKPFLPIGEVSVSYTQVPVMELLNGDLFRIDESGCDGTVEGVELYLLGSSILNV